MAIIRRANFSHRDPGDRIPTGSEIHGGNFSQLIPNTEIMVDHELLITGGNWMNVKRQSQWNVKGGNWAQVSRCSNLHSDWVLKGLPKCNVDCEHYVRDDPETGDPIYKDKSWP